MLSLVFDKDPYFMLHSTLQNYIASSHRIQALASEIIYAVQIDGSVE